MIMKRVTLGFSILTAVALFIAGCKKPKDNEVPEPDTEVQPALDATWATYVMTDVEMLCAFTAERNYYQHFYAPIPGAVGGTMTVVNDTISKNIVMSFSQTACLDGHLRNGTIIMQYGNFTAEERRDYIPKQSPNALGDATYARSYGFGGFLTFSAYSVDSVKIETPGNSKLVITSEVSPAGYDASKVPLTWRFRGTVNLTDTKLKDNMGDMTWTGDLIKTCTNSTNKDSVFKYTANHLNEGPIRWAAAKVTYHGRVVGTTPTNRPYTYVIPAETPLYRDFRCYPDKVGGVVVTTTPGVVQVRASELHPFISGVVSFSNVSAEGKALYPRTINFGSEGNLVPDMTNAECDNVGDIYIKGISYRVNFRNNSLKVK